MSKYFGIREKCPACNSSDIAEIKSVPYEEPVLKEYLMEFYASTGGGDYKYLSAANFALDKCLSCGLVYQKEIPGEELSAILYDIWIDKNVTLERQKHKDLNYFLCVAQEITSIIEYFGETPGKLKMLDFGMGWGNWCRMAKGFGCHASGMELSLERIKSALESGIEIIDWEELPNRNFHFINTDRVFEHLPEPLKTLSHLAKGLSSNGVIKINVPEGTDIEKAINAWDWKAPRDSELTLNAISPLEHLNCYSRNTLLKMAYESGLELVKIPKSSKIIPPNPSCWAQNRTASSSHWGDTYLFFKKR